MLRRRRGRSVVSSPLSLLLESVECWRNLAPGSFSQFSAFLKDFVEMNPTPCLWFSLCDPDFNAAQPSFWSSQHPFLSHRKLELYDVSIPIFGIIQKKNPSFGRVMKKWKWWSTFSFPISISITILCFTCKWWIATPMGNSLDPKKSPIWRAVGGACILSLQYGTVYCNLELTHFRKHLS